MQTQPEGREPAGVLVLRTLAMPRDTNPWGDIFGGWILSQMDVAAGLLAGEVAQGRCATVTVGDVAFHSPVSVGQTVCAYAELLRVGRTSLDIRIEVWARGLVHQWEPDHDFVAEGVFRYVAIDAEGRPRVVPDNPEFFTR